MKQFIRVLVVVLLLLLLSVGALYLIGGRQYQFASKIEIDAPQSTVFHNLTDGERIPEWVGGLVQWESQDDKGYRPGARKRRVVQSAGQPIQIIDEVMEATTGRMLKVHTTSQLFDAITIYQLEPKNNGTTLNYLTYTTPKKFFRVLAPLVQSRIQRGIDDDLGRLKRLAESSPTP